MNVNMANDYQGELIMPDGRVIKFILRGTTKFEVENLIRHAQPRVRIKMARKAK